MGKDAEADALALEIVPNVGWQKLKWREIICPAFDELRKMVKSPLLEKYLSLTAPLNHALGDCGLQLEALKTVVTRLIGVAVLPEQDGVAHVAPDDIRTPKISKLPLQIRTTRQDPGITLACFKDEIALRMLLPAQPAERNPCP